MAGMLDGPDGIDEDAFARACDVPFAASTTCRYRMCRVCKRMNPKGETLLKYGVRHYAHPVCFAKRFGLARLAELPSHVLGELPALPLHEAGFNVHKLYDDAKRREAMADAKAALTSGKGA